MKTSEFYPKKPQNRFFTRFFLLFPSRFPMTTTPAPPSRPPFGQDGGAKFKARDGKSTPLRSVRTERCLSTRFPTLPSHLFVRSRHRRNAIVTRHPAPFHTRHFTRSPMRDLTPNTMHISRRIPCGITAEILHDILRAFDISRCFSGHFCK